MDAQAHPYRPPVSAISLPGIPDADVTEKLLDPNEEEAAAARRLAAIQALCDSAIRQQDTVALPALLRSANEASKGLAAARVNAIDHRVRMGQLRPEADFQRISQMVLDGLDLVQHLADEVSPQLGFDQGTAFSVLDEWVSKRFRPRWQEIIRQCGGPSE